MLWEVWEGFLEEVMTELRSKEGRRRQNVLGKVVCKGLGWEETEFAQRTEMSGVAGAKRRKGSCC